MDNEERAKEIAIDLAKRLERAGIHSFAADMYNSLSVSFKHEKPEIGRTYSKKAIELATNSGHNFFLEVYWRALGHSYFTSKDFYNAHLAYLKAIEYGKFHKDSSSLAIDHAYAGWALFKMDTVANIDTANHYYNRSFDYSKKQGMTYGEAL